MSSYPCSPADHTPNAGVCTRPRWSRAVADGKCTCANAFRETPTEPGECRERREHTILRLAPRHHVPHPVASVVLGLHLAELRVGIPELRLRIRHPLPYVSHHVLDTPAPSTGRPQPGLAR